LPIMVFNTILGFADQTFTVLILVVTAGISVQIAFGFGTKKARDNFIVLILGVLVVVQMYYLVHAVLYIPATQFYTFNPKFHRTDCFISDKGGKRPLASKDALYQHPCYCYDGTKYNTRVRCMYRGSKQLENSLCPTDGSANCEEYRNPLDPENFAFVKPYLDDQRDCLGGQATKCTVDQPCTPCELDTLHLWNYNRCRNCVAHIPDDCHFVPGVGPYCKVSPTSKQVVPCKNCCTENKVIVINHTCY